MSKLETVIVASETMKKPSQEYEKLVTWFNIPSRPDFFAWVYKKQKYDIFGILPDPFVYADKHSLTKIVNAFNLDPQNTLCVVSKEEINGKQCLFINKNLANMQYITNLDSILDYAECEDYKALTVKGLFKNGKA